MAGKQEMPLGFSLYSDPRDEPPKAWPKTGASLPLSAFPTGNPDKLRKEGPGEGGDRGASPAEGTRSPASARQHR